MSLDVYLRVRYPDQVERVVERIYVRRNGATVEISREEWDELYPGRNPVVLTDEDSDGREVYSANITHNMGRMATEVDLYKPLWRPGEIEITHAWQLIEPLRVGLARMRSERERLLEFNPANGWGDYNGFLGFVEGYLSACESNPDAEVSVWV